MKTLIQKYPLRFITCTCLLATILVNTGCKKEKALEPTNQDGELTVTDNPNDPVDHQIYLFYQSTGIPCFYNDTISRKRLSDSAGLPRYQYRRLSLGYSPYGIADARISLLKDKQLVLPLLNFLKTNVVPRLPKSIFIPSILFVDTFSMLFPRTFMGLEDGWKAYHGFNTVAIKYASVDALSATEKKLYASSLLAGMTERTLTVTGYPTLQKEFYQVSRDIVKAYPAIDADIYETYALDFYLPTVPRPEELGFLRYIVEDLTWEGVPNFIYHVPPRETDDLRMYLAAMFNYTTQEFTATYTGYPAVIKKFSVIKEMARKLGFQFPD